MKTAAAKLSDEQKEALIQKRLAAEAAKTKGQPLPEADVRAWFERLFKGNYVPHVIEPSAGLDRMALAVIADVMAIGAGLVMSASVLDIPPHAYIQSTIDQVGPRDFLTGLAKAGVFGLLIGLIACANGLKVSGGAAGVGRATTNTVVESIVAIIFADLIFTAVFYALGWT